MTASVHLSLFSSHHTIELKQSCMQLMASFLKHQDVTLFIHIHVSAVGRAKASSVQYLLTIRLLYPQRNSSSAKRTGLQTMYTPSPFKSAGVNSDQLWLCPCHPKTLRRNSLRLQQTILHHCTFCTSANSFGMRGCQCVFYSERESEIRDIICKHTSMCIHYESNDHLKARDVTNVWKKKKKWFYIFVFMFNYLSCNSFLKKKKAAILY